jgi:hypothetical protein
MLLKEALDEKKFDKRLQDKHLEEGKVKKDEFAKFLDALTDDKANLTYTSETHRAGQLPS